jgi:hypothetical protein
LPVQAKLSVSQPGDVYEEEADRVADHVMRMAEPTVQRACAPCAAGGAPCPKCEEESGIVQRKVGSSDHHATADDNLMNGVGPGQPLDVTTRSFMEPRFGVDFSNVRVHTGTQANESAKALNALAYTTGRDIVFAQRQYDPASSDGQRLLAHELTHVVQQSGHESKTIQRYHHHSSCTASDLSGVVWPGDRAFRLMVAKAIRVLSASPIDPRVRALFPKYFMTPTPAVATILGVFTAVQSVITADNYTYECEHSCGPDEAASVRHRLRYIGYNPNIHLCINHMSGYTLNCNASLILHEMTHYASHLDDESTACGACSTTGCPASLSASDALDNTYSYADFAYELYPMPV